MIAKHFIFGGIVLCLLSCSHEIAQPIGKNANSELVISNEPTPLTSEHPTRSPVKIVGCFTNVQSNGEHEWGYSVDIWRQDDRIHGLFSGSSSSMLVGDPPTGILEDPVFDAKTGKLSFKTRLPYNTIYQFEGILTNKTLKGRLLDTTYNKTEKIVLNRSKELSNEMMDEYANYEDWKEFADRILKFRGPKP